MKDRKMFRRQWILTLAFTLSLIALSTAVAAKGSPEPGQTVPAADG